MRFLSRAVEGLALRNCGNRVRLWRTDEVPNPVRRVSERECVGEDERIRMPR